LDHGVFFYPVQITRICPLLIIISVGDFIQKLLNQRPFLGRFAAGSSIARGPGIRSFEEGARRAERFFRGVVAQGEERDIARFFVRGGTGDVTALLR
jgi:hypothetical protein